MLSTQTAAIAPVDHRKPFVCKVMHEGQDGRWAHVEVYQIDGSQALNVTPSIARQLNNLGATGQVAGNFNAPTSLRLVVGMDRNSPVMLISALTTHLSRCAHAMNSTFQAVIRDDTVGTGPWTADQQKHLSAVMNTATHRASRVKLPAYEPVDHGLPFVYRVDREVANGRAAHVQVFQDRRDRRVDVTHALGDHLMALDAVGQVTGNFMQEGGVRLVAAAPTPVNLDDPHRFETSLRSSLSRCANAMGARVQPLRRDDHAQEGPVPATSVPDETAALLAEAEAPRAVPRAARPRA